jgi:NADH-quinone oxidoreductase subunit L
MSNSFLDSLIITIVFLPLLGSILSYIMGYKYGDKTSIFISSTLLTISAICSIYIFSQVIFNKLTLDIEILRWIDIGTFKANWSIHVDALTSIMFLVVTSVSSLVHIYSAGYMSHDPNVPRFMSYLSLFTFFMLLLVSADNLIQLFVGWEGVGLCSYLLIGYWYKKPSACNAAIKAFVVNRIGDFAFALGIFSVFIIFDSVEFKYIFSTISEKQNTIFNILGYQLNAIDTMCILLFIGAMGKSAQIGLHTWLPDAMEGPTPVSALIHAATMVTAGVFLIARFSPVFEYSPIALQFITIIGATTALFAATVAITQNDIKKIIAYSTCSQLGYMFFACGVSAYPAAIFHLMTHAFFKALLFLGAGSVIHAMSDEQDITKMGGIWKKIPLTYGLMWIGSLALAGIYPFAGFYSKDAILEAAYASHSQVGQYAYIVGTIAAFLTAFYSWRLIILVFHGKPNASAKIMEHVHESPKVMLFPLIILAVGALTSGVIAYNMGIIDANMAFWGNSLSSSRNNILEQIHHIPTIYKYLPLIVAILGIFTAYKNYVFITSIPKLLCSCFDPVYI